MIIEAIKLAAEFNRYFTSANGVDVPAKVSVSRDEWRALFTAIQQAEAQQPATGEPMLSTDIAPRPLSYSLDDYHRAPSEGTLHYTWQDKPHRLLYDLIAAVAYYAGKQPATPEPVAWSEREQLRHAQAAVVMPMIGPLLDAWENSDREVMSQEPELSKQLNNINSAMEDADTHPAPSVSDGVVRDAERWRTFLATRPSNTHEVVNAAIDAAMLAAK